ncbi:hypothetical protein TBLA_0C04100 [Henningerozyma blattae CBS 6284]|uniref:Actin cytoskeleton-regulatory complex protein SLA1 n=1 Tax=Henningerozyma blattae (strain ATCC 34711 / CBS 6284 / DSM 70876 / NBRC 10599 / NRRL Y-10934 / UCD 77-7) TaxID=1071380 RepID=I2H1F8_HENB6|nr:hypothetical protein TBLA_0C04100 [Tetrapisispora blattae CBS 6284]CCH60210.1 hypothetical protein TBLA_0C04100 [Tetrapisispora blattae CBS 6284]
MTIFLGIYKAVYAYEPQTPEELAIEEDDLLYLLEKSDVDDWWTVKKRVLGTDADEPTGLVPSNYVEEAPIISQVKAIYNYDEAQNPDEELLFNENEIFDVFDDRDQDWLLVKSRSANQVGFVPGNYVEPISGGAVPAAPTAAPILPAAVPPPQDKNERSSFPSSEQRNGRDTTQKDIPPAKPTRPNQQQSQLENDNAPIPTPIYGRDIADNEGPPPPTKPARPTSTMEPNYPDRSNSPRDSARDNTRDKARSRTSYHENSQPPKQPNRPRDTDSSRPRQNTSSKRDGPLFDSDYHTWNVAEVDGHKKTKAKLSVGSNKIFFTPQRGNEQEWTIDKLISYDNEKKHMFLEFVDPYKSLEIHTGTTAVCDEIKSILGEYKGASRDRGLREVQQASQTKRKAQISYDFLAESHDELTVHAGDAVYVIDDQKSSEWWMVELISTGKKGVVPADFVEPFREKSGHTGGKLFKSLKKIGRSKSFSSKSKDKSPPANEGSGSKSGSSYNTANMSGSWKDDAQQNAVGSSSESRKRRSSMSHKKDFPDPKKSRIWADKTGTFKVEAQFIGCKDGKIHLHKANGVKIAVPAGKLSTEDIVYVERLTGFSLNKYKDQPRSNQESSRDDGPERRMREREQEEKEYDRKLRNRELSELRRAREALDQERERLENQPPAKPLRPQQDDRHNADRSYPSNNRKSNYDWFEFFLNCGVDVSNCQRYTTNFDKEKITEDMMEDINNSMLRTLGLREGDIVRVMKFLDNKFNRNVSPQPAPADNAPANNTGMFTEADGSLKVNNNQSTPQVAQQLLPQSQPQPQPPIQAQQPAPSPEPAAAPAPAPAVVTTDDDAWTTKPAAKSEHVANQSDFTGSMQDLLDLQPLEPSKKPATITSSNNTTPEPNLKLLQPVKTATVAKEEPNVATTTTATAAATATESSIPSNLVPLDPFKTGGNNYLPSNTTFVLMPFTTGSAMPAQITGGVIPQTTFGMQLTGGVMPTQRTGGLIPIATTGGAMPQTTFGTQVTTSALPLQTTGGLLPISTTGGLMPQTTFGAIPQTSFTAKPASTILPTQTTGGFISASLTGGANIPSTSFNAPPAVATVLPVQKTANGLIPANPLGMPSQLTGGLNPQTSFGAQLTGGAMMPATSFATQMTGGAMLPATSFTSQMTGGAMMPQTSFNNQFSSSIAPIQNNMMNPMNKPATSFGTQFTGGAMPMQNNMMNPITQPQTSFGMQPSVNGFQPKSQFGVNLQRTGGAMNQLTGSAMGNITQGLQNTSISQPLQTQPTGMGFGNAPTQQQQQNTANVFNASVSNPFGL